EHDRHDRLRDPLLRHGRAALVRRAGHALPLREHAARARLADVHLARALPRAPLLRPDPPVDAALALGDDARLGARGLGRAPPPGVGGDAQATGLTVSLADQ